MDDKLSVGQEVEQPKVEELVLPSEIEVVQIPQQKAENTPEAPVTSEVAVQSEQEVKTEEPGPIEVEPAAKGQLGDADISEDPLNTVSQADQLQNLLNESMT